MKKLIILLTIIPFIAMATPQEHEKTYTPLGCYQDTDMASAQALISLPADATHALLHAEGADVRWTDSGVAPTSSVGIQLVAGATQPFFYAGDLTLIQVIEETTSSILNVCYYK